MGDTHFLLRHAIVGAVFLVFAWIGWWLFAGDPAWGFFTQRIATEGFAAISALVLAPLIGITIQGLHIVALQIGRGGVFNDRARVLLKARMDDAIGRCKANRKLVTKEDWERLESAPADSLFVWLYHRSAPAELIEWARRRRSYYYLGVNLVVAVLGGIAAGWLAPQIAQASPCLKLLTSVVAGALWCAGALMAAFAMRDDVERMELLWVAARIDPALKACLEKEFGTNIHETPSGGGSGGAAAGRAGMLDPRGGEAPAAEAAGTSSQSAVREG